MGSEMCISDRMCLWSALLGGCHFFLHAAGWLEGGLSASYEKFIIDVEMLQMFASMLNIPEVTEDTLGLAAMREVGHGGHYFGCAHTMARYADAFYPPLVSDWDNYENWREKGGLTATQRAGRLWQQALADYARPPMDPDTEQALKAFVARRKAEGGAAPG